jgi:hypothetical protein
MLVDDAALEEIVLLKCTLVRGGRHWDHREAWVWEIDRVWGNDGILEEV